MGHLQNIQSFETSIETGNLQSYDEQSSPCAEAWKWGLSVPLWETKANVIFWKVH